MNFNGIYSFEYTNIFGSNDSPDFHFKEKFNYPINFRNELDYWFREKNCMERLITHLYDKYLLITQYRSDVQLLEGKRIFSFVNKYLIIFEYYLFNNMLISLYLPF